MANCPDIIVIENTLDEVIIIENVGLPGAGDKHFTWVQSIAQSTWTVPHNLNKLVSYIVLDSLNAVILVDCIYLDNNTIQIHHGLPMTGTVICN